MIEIADIILKYLYKNPKNGYHVEADILKNTKFIKEDISIEIAIKLLKHKGVVDMCKSEIGGDECLVINLYGIEIIDKHGSFSKYLEYTKNEESKAKRRESIKYRFLWIGVIVLIFNFIITFLNFCENRAMNERNDKSLQLHNTTLQEEESEQGQLLNKLDTHKTESDSIILRTKKNAP